MADLFTNAEAAISGARTLITAGGYSHFSYPDPAGDRGVAQSAIHSKFPTKAVLVQVMLERYRQEALDGLASLERNVTDPLAQLQSYVGYWERCVFDPSASICVCAVLASELPLLPEGVASEIKGHFRDLSSWLSSVLEKGSAQGIFNLSNPPRVEAETFMATAHGAMMSARAYQEPEIFGLIMQRVLHRFSKAA
jgi:TetR/AcrR family transcriptional repressor of nem operon